MLSSERENASTTLLVSERHGYSANSEARIVHAAVEFTYVLVALARSLPARMGKRISAAFQQLLLLSLQTRIRGPAPFRRASSTSSALWPEVVTIIGPANPACTPRPKCSHSLASKAEEPRPLSHSVKAPASDEHNDAPMPSQST